MATNRNNLSKRFQAEVYRRFTRKNGGKIAPRNKYNFIPDKPDIKYPKRTTPSPTEPPYLGGSKYGPNRPKPNVNRRKDQESEPNRPRRRRRRNDFPRSTKPNRPGNHKPIENNKPQPHQHTHPNKTPNPLPPRTTPRTPPPTNTGPLPPKSKFDVSDIPRRSSYPVKYGPNRPKPTDPIPNPPQTYPVGSKYGPNRPMPKVDGSTRTSRYDFTRKDVSATPKNFDNETLLRKLNRRRNGS